MIKTDLIWDGSVSDFSLGDCLGQNELRIEDPNKSDDDFVPRLCFKHRVVRDILKEIHEPDDGNDPDVYMRRVVSGGFTICSATVICNDGIVNIMYKFKIVEGFEPYFEDPDDDDTYVDDSPLDDIFVFRDICISYLRYVG